VRLCNTMFVYYELIFLANAKGGNIYFQVLWIFGQSFKWKFTNKCEEILSNKTPKHSPNKLPLRNHLLTLPYVSVCYCNYIQCCEKAMSHPSFLHSARKKENRCNVLLKHVQTQMNIRQKQSLYNYNEIDVNILCNAGRLLLDKLSCSFFQVQTCLFYLSVIMKKWFKLPPPFSPFGPALPPRCVFFKSSGFWVLLQALLRLWDVQLAANNFSVAMVLHLNRCKSARVPAEVIPASQHPNQHRKIFQKSFFFSEYSQ